MSLFLVNYNNSLSLNTQLGSPHGKGKVKGIVQHPSRDLVVTFGSDANFKFWLRDGESKVQD